MGTADGEVARRYRVLPTPPTIARAFHPPSAKLCASWHCMHTYQCSAGQHNASAGLPYSSWLREVCKQCSSAMAYINEVSTWLLASSCTLPVYVSCTRWNKLTKGHAVADIITFAGTLCMARGCDAAFARHGDERTMPHRLVDNAVHKPCHETSVTICAATTPCSS